MREPSRETGRERGQPAGEGLGRHPALVPAGVSDSPAGVWPPPRTPGPPTPHREGQPRSAAGEQSGRPHGGRLTPHPGASPATDNTPDTRNRIRPTGTPAAGDELVDRSVRAGSPWTPGGPKTGVELECSPGGWPGPPGSRCALGGDPVDSPGGDRAEENGAPRRGVRVSVKCPNGHPADTHGRCYVKTCRYSRQSGAPKPY